MTTATLTCKYVEGDIEYGVAFKGHADQKHVCFAMTVLAYALCEALADMPGVRRTEPGNIEITWRASAADARTAGLFELAGKMVDEATNAFPNNLKRVG